MDSSVCTLQALPLSSAAVRITDAYKRYGNPSKGKVVLDHLNMTVPRGVIYGLLGASGCGKTTLLSCIVGRRDLNSGDIWVLGGKPGTRGSGVPGPRVGYMPQEVALVGEFTVKGAIYYFGNIYGMSSERLHERFQFLSRLLDLPPADRLVNQLSGGQQRRVSFASALVHEPELLILDEPTVGLDPVLRENMWNHLVDLTSNHNVAVIITTHYIEEARLAHAIGLMRGGQLLAEDSPSHLMTMFGRDTLEDVFLILSEKQSRGEVVQQLQDVEYRREKLKREAELGSKNTLVSSTADVTQFSSTTAITKDLSLEKRIKKAEQVLHPGRIKALFTKNMLQFTRHPGGLIFTLLFPIIEIVAFFSAVGGDLNYLKMAIVNHESNQINCYNYTSQYKTAVYDPSNFTCNLNMLSCRFLNSLNETTITQVHYDHLDQALDSVKNGQTIGVVYFSENFTQAMEARREDGRHTTNYDLNSAEIQVYLDMAEHTKANTLRKYLLDKYISFSEGMFKDCNEPPKLGSIPVNFFEPVYGKSDYTYTIFTAPGMIVTMVFFLAAIITSTIIITDRLEGTWDRSMVAGITTSELMLTHFVTQFTVMAAQNFLVLLFSLVIYELPLKGSVLTVLFLLLLEGLAGMSYGFLTSVVSSSHTMANFALTGSFYPIILLSGMMWPIESMPTGLMWFSLCLPCTFPIISLRNIMFKGWLFTHWSIFGGYLITFGWIAVFCILSFFILRKRM